VPSKPWRSIHVRGQRQGFAAPDIGEARSAPNASQAGRAPRRISCCRRHGRS
jgi:hypothetical protein